MKVRLNFKTPDVIEQISGDFPEDDNEMETLVKCIQKYVKYGELISIEFDTETGEANVLPVGK